MKPFARSERISGHIQKILSDLLKKKIKDPRLETATVTRVEMTGNLRTANIYFAARGGRKNGKKANAGFKSALGYLRRSLANNLGLRYMPELKFFYDESFEYGARIDELLKSVDEDITPNNTKINQ